MSRSSLLSRSRLSIRSLRRTVDHPYPTGSSSVKLLPHRRSFVPISSRTSSVSLEWNAVVPETGLLHQRRLSIPSTSPSRFVRLEWSTLFCHFVRFPQHEILPSTSASDVGRLGDVVPRERATSRSSVVAVELDLERSIGRHAMGTSTRPAIDRLSSDSRLWHASRSQRFLLRVGRRFDILRWIDFRRNRAESRVVHHVIPRQLLQLPRIDRVHQLFGRTLATIGSKRITQSWSCFDAIPSIRHFE